MADKKITELNPLQSADITQNDVAAVADVSANETRKVTVPDLVQAGVRLMPDGSIDGDKIAIDSIGTGPLEPGSVTGGPNGIIALDTITGDNIQDGAIDTAQLADGAVTTDKIEDGAVTGAKLDPGAFDRGIDLTNEKVGITNSITPGTQAGISYNEQGLITSVTDPIPPEDLPIATETTLGAVIVPDDSGIGVLSTGEIYIDNLVTPDTKCKVSYNIHGLITQGEDLEPDDLPIATSTTIGGVAVPAVDADGDTALDIDGNGLLTHSESGVTPGTYTKVSVNKYGHVTVGSSLTAADIPEISADSITSGEIGSDLLAECAVEAPNICDYATCLMQEDNPGAGDFLGQFWFTPSTAQLRVYARGSGPENIWLPVGFGNLQANNLRWAGLYDADADTVTSVTAIGTSDGITSGPFPIPTDELSGIYLACQVAGNNMSQNQLQGVTHTPGDWVVCLGAAQGWVHIDVTVDGGGGGGGGAQVLDDLNDVTIGGTASPFSTNPAYALEGDQILRYDGGAGVWRNTSVIDGGSID